MKTERQKQPVKANIQTNSETRLLRIAYLDKVQKWHVPNFWGRAFWAETNVKVTRPLKAWKMPEYQGNCMFPGSPLLNPCLKYSIHFSACRCGGGVFEAKIRQMAAFKYSATLAAIIGHGVGGMQVATCAVLGVGQATLPTKRELL